MRRVFVGLTTVVFLAGFAAVAEHVFRSAPLDKPKQGGGPYPSDWFGLQRALPRVRPLAYRNQVVLQPFYGIAQRPLRRPRNCRWRPMPRKIRFRCRNQR